MPFVYSVGMTIFSMLTGSFLGAVLMGHTLHGEFETVEQELLSCYDFNASEGALYPQTKEFPK